MDSAHESKKNSSLAYKTKKSGYPKLQCCVLKAYDYYDKIFWSQEFLFSIYKQYILGVNQSRFICSTSHQL